MATYTSNNYDGRYLQLVISETTNAITNKSTLNWTLTSAGGAVSYYTIGATTVIINGSTVYSKGQTSWDSQVFPAKKGSVSGSIDVEHNGDGSKSISIVFNTRVYYNTPVNYGGTLDLTNIDRSAPSISISTSSVTASSVYLSATASTTCDIWDYTINNGATYTQYSTGGKTKANITITGLTPNTNYTIAVRARKQSNRVVGYSGTSSIKTLGGSVINSIDTFTADNATANLILLVTVYNTSYIHTLVLKDGSTTVLTLSDLTLVNGSNTITLTPSQQSTVLSAMSSKKSYTGTFELKTYIGSTQIGNTSSKTATVQTTAANSSPTFSSFEYEDSNSASVAVTENNQILIQGISTLKVVASTAIAKNGATISGYSVVAGNTTAASTTTTINVGIVSNTGTVPVIVTAIDSRGWTTLVTVNITVIAYDKIVISDYMMRRINEVEDTTQVFISGIITPVKVGEVEKNSLDHLYYRYKKTSDDSYGNWSDLISQTDHDNNSFTFDSDEWISIDADYSWYVQFLVTDKLTSDIVTITIPQGIPLLSFRRKKVGVNKREPEVAFDIVGEMKQNGAYVMGYIGNVESDFNDYKSGGIFKYSGAGASNSTGSAGLLEVVTSGDGYVIQRFTAFSEGCAMYVRSYFNNTWTSWILK